ncbi:phage tail sheath family protein [Cellulosilyticum ruminicola]|uniref:phage tail sheath family protein n=1 Tax=Cellulosilyticum ruminicola TaxID=425254 RepID=UPI00278C4CAA|nr:phage tail sheath subtilisin-like domain-containing protein [Cellulosilyticum ruminicola]
MVWLIKRKPSSMPEYLSPGVYVEEFDSGLKAMEGVSTSTAGFVGMAERGPVIGAPEFITSFADYQRKFGGYLSANAYEGNRFLPYAVEHFFLNGGSRCFVMRVAPEDAMPAQGEDAGKILSFTAANPGAWGDKIKIAIRKSMKAKTQIIGAEGKQFILKSTAGFVEGDIVVFNDLSDEKAKPIYNKIIKIVDRMVTFAEAFDEKTVVDTDIVPTTALTTCDFDLSVSYDNVQEQYEKLSLNPNASNYIVKKVAKSNLVQITVNLVEDIKHPVDLIFGEETEGGKITLEGGSDGTTTTTDASVFIGSDKGPGQRTGIASFIENSNVSIMAVPGIVDPAVQLALVAHCENLGSRFAVLDVPMDKVKVTDVAAHRGIMDTSYAAMYHPWIEMYDALDKKSNYMPPSGAMMGIYARSDMQHGVHKAPANESVRGCTGLSSLYNKAEQDILNPQGVNLIRNIPGKGIQVWGARTCSSDGNWKYVNVRRLFIYVEESIKANTNWAVFEPNDEVLWARVGRTIGAFLSTIWRDGALAGATEDQAYFVNIGRDTMTQDDILNGRLICVIGIAPVRPAEFVIFRITQKMEE